MTRALEERVRSSSDEDLAELFPTYIGLSSAPKASRVVRMATHDIYHSGQIRYLRALQGV